MALPYPPLLEQTYAIIISSPQITVDGVPNQDAVAATLVNALLETIGSHQQIFRVLDLRNEWTRKTVTQYLVDRKMLSTHQQIPTPIFYSRAENTFASPGLVSLELLLFFASYYISFPSKSLAQVLSLLPQVEKLNLPESWKPYILRAIDEKKHALDTVEGQFYNRYAHHGERDDTFNTAAVAAAEAMADPSSLKRLPREDNSMHQAQTTYMTGMETYVDYSVAQRYANAPTKIAGRIPERLLRQSEKMKDGAILIREKDVMPKTSDMKSQIDRARERRTRYRRELENKWKEQASGSATSN